MRFRVLALSLALLTAVLAGCGDDGDSPSANGDDGRSEAELAADESAAEAAVLRLDDLPAGWSPTPPDDDEDDEIIEQLAACLEVDPERLNPDNPSAEAGFESAADEQVTSRVAFTASAEFAADQMALLQDERTPDCYVAAIAEVLEANLADPEPGEEAPEGLELGEPTFTPISFASLGDESVAYRATIPFSIEGFDAAVYVDFVAVVVGRAGLTMTFQSILSPFDLAEAERLAEIVVDRMAESA